MDGSPAIRSGKGDNPFDPDVAEGREFQRHRRNIDAMTEALRGRSDLLYLALDQRMLMRDFEAHLASLKQSAKLSGAHVQSSLLAREVAGAVANHKAASDRFREIEAAMNEETRYKFWQYTADERLRGA
jgi:hypothetical protein